MNILLIVLKIFPLVLAATQAVEQAIPLPGQGNNYVVDPFMLRCAP